MSTAPVSSPPGTSQPTSQFSAVAALAATPFATLDEVIDVTLRLMSDLIGVKLSMIHRLEGDTIIVSHVCDRIGLGLQPPVTIKRTDTFCDVVLANVAPLIVLDADVPPYDSMPGKQLVGTKSYIGVPILSSAPFAPTTAAPSTSASTTSTCCSCSRALWRRTSSGTTRSKCSSAPRSVWPSATRS